MDSSCGKNRFAQSQARPVFMDRARRARKAEGAGGAAVPELGRTWSTLVCGPPHGRRGPQTGGRLPSRPSPTSSAGHSAQLLTGAALPPVRHTIQKTPSLQINGSTWVSVGQAMSWEADAVPPGLGVEAGTMEPGCACVRPVATHTLVQQEPESPRTVTIHTHTHTRVYATVNYRQ